MEVYDNVKSGCVFSIIFAVAALVIFTLLAPILFKGADMVKVGRNFFLPAFIVGGVIGYFVGLSRQK